MSESSVPIEAVTVPSPPTLDVVAVSEIRKHSQSGRDTGPEGMAGDRILAWKAKVGQKGR